MSPFGTNTTGTTTRTTLDRHDHRQQHGLDRHADPARGHSYSANIASAASSPLPAGAAVSFYQTLAKGKRSLRDRGRVPSILSTRPCSSPQGLSEGTIDSGTYVASGDNINIVSAAPGEGCRPLPRGRQRARLRDGPLDHDRGTTQARHRPVVPLPACHAGRGCHPGSLVAAVTPANATQYDHGQLLVSHEGTLVASVPLDAVLAQGGGRCPPASPPVRPPRFTTFRFGSGTASNPAGTLYGSRFRPCLTCVPRSSATLPVTIN